MRIETRLAERLKKINPSSTLAITSKAKKLKEEGKDIISLAAGEPDFDTPDFIKDAAIEAIKSGFTKYTPTTGIPDLKKCICEKFKKDNLLDYDPDQIVVSCGAKHSIFNILLALVDRTDEVLIPTPYWVSYPEMVNLCEGTPRFIKTLPENNFKITIKDLEKYINPATKVLILNSPSNPTGSVYAEDELKEIARLCVLKKIFVISDEIYEKIIFDNRSHSSIASFGKEIYDMTITVNGMSKSYSMTGWRIGYIGAPPDIAEAISRIQDHSTSNPTSISQKAAVAALKAPDEFSKTMCVEFEKRRDYIASRLKKMKRMGFVMPQGAFYLFPKVGDGDIATARLAKAGVIVVPGSAFGPGGKEHIRLSYASSRENLEEALRRMKGIL